MKHYRTHTIASRFTLLVACLLLISMVTLGVVTYNGFSGMVDHKVEQLSQNILSLICKNLDYVISDVKDTSNLLLTSRAVQQTLYYAGRKDSAISYNQSMLDSVDLMNNMINNKSYLSAVYVGNKDTSLISKKSAYFHMEVSNIDYDSPPSWLQTVLSKEGQGVWFHSREMMTFEGSLLVYARKMRSLYTLQDLGIMLIALDTQTLEDIFSEVGRTNHMSIAIWEDEKMIYAFDPLDAFASLDDETLYKTVGNLDGFTQVDGTRCYVSNMDNASSGWRISCFVPYADFETEKRHIAQWIASLSAALLLTAVALANYITRRSITGTLTQLKRYVASLRQHENQGIERFSFDRDDEVGLIGREFVRVVEDNERLMVNLYKSRYREKEAELIALQSQINPHFLYNTLDCIFWAAQEYGAEDISRITVALSNLFRLSLNRGKGVCRLRDEIELVRNYLTVQNIRYEERFHARILIPEPLMDLEIIKLILQPVVENAIQHGLEKKVGEGEITLSVEEQGDRLVFVVTDDGVGFTVDSENPLGNGYALHNVDERIKLYYGEDCGVEIQSQPSSGTVVRITIHRTFHMPGWHDGEREDDHV